MRQAIIISAVWHGNRTNDDDDFLRWDDHGTQLSALECLKTDGGHRPNKTHKHIHHPLVIHHHTYI